MYYLWLNDAQAGPYTLLQVQSMWSEGKITALTLFWQEGNADWQPLSAIQSTIEPETPPALLEKTAVIPQFEQKLVKKVHIQAATHPTTTAPATATAHEEHVEWTGFPTWWKWLLLLGFDAFLVLIILPLSIFFFPPFSIFVAMVVLPLAALVFIYIYLARSFTKYTVTNRRVSVESGILNKTSRELRIQDIRSIAADINFLGYGNILFSSASEDVDVTFTAVSGAAAVRDLVKKLQA